MTFLSHLRHAGTFDPKRQKISSPGGIQTSPRKKSNKNFPQYYRLYLNARFHIWNLADQIQANLYISRP